MKYLIIILGLAILGWGILNLVSSRTENGVCGNQTSDYKGWRDCTPTVRVRDTGEPAMKDSAGDWSLMSELNNKAVWAVIGGTALTLLGGVMLMKRTAAAKKEINK